MRKPHIINTIILFTVAMVILVVTVIQQNKKNTPTSPSPTLLVVTTPYSEKDTMNKTVVVSNFSNSSLASGQPNNNFNKKIYVTGSIDKGYIYVKASVDGRALNPNENVYLKIQDEHTLQQVGGHLLADKSLGTGYKSPAYSELLYYLNDVRYKLNNQPDGYEVLSGDLLDFLNQNQNDTKSILGFISTIHTGLLIQVNIYYTCSSSTPNCSVTVQ